MSLTELKPELQKLPRDAKVAVIQLLVSDLARQQGGDLLQNGASYPVWTPFNAHDAAKSLQQLLDRLAGVCVGAVQCQPVAAGSDQLLCGV